MTKNSSNVHQQIQAFYYLPHTIACSVSCRLRTVGLHDSQLLHQERRNGYPCSQHKLKRQLGPLLLLTKYKAENSFHTEILLQNNQPEGNLYSVLVVVTM